MTLIRNLATLATQVMKEKGLQPDFSKEELQQLDQIHRPALPSSNHVDLRSLLWCSIDNDDSRDLDQLTYAEKTGVNQTTLWVAVADVDALVKKESFIDIHAQINTTSVYTPAKIFSMLPEKLSTDLTSLNENEDRLAIVIKIQIDQTGHIEAGSVFQALVRNGAKLTYNATGDWLEGKKPAPNQVAKKPELEKTLKIQHEVAQRLKQKRHEAGSLTLEASESEVRILYPSELKNWNLDSAKASGFDLSKIGPVSKVKSRELSLEPKSNSSAHLGIEDDQIDIQTPAHNFAHQLIEEFMIAANRVMADHLNKAKIASLRRVVRLPQHWNRIVEIAQEFNETLPKEPNSKALDAFLIKRKKADPATFAELSLTIIKLLGRGEYIVENDPKMPIGHFALSVSSYTHSTAPNRRFPDLITQRQYKAFLNGEPSPYPLEELHFLAAHCSRQEDAAMKVERRLRKSTAAALLSSQIGNRFEGIVTGAGPDGTWIRILKPPIEGKIIHGFEKLKIGDKISVQLSHINIEQGFIDFIR